MDAETILAQLRALVLVVDGDGVIEDVRGGRGGFMGLDLDAIAGTNVFQHVAPAEVDGLAAYFVDAADTDFDTASLPLPFRVTMLDAHGAEQPVDVIPAGLERGEAPWAWIVLVVPAALSASVIRPLEAEMAGEPRERVKELLAEELAVDNEQYTSRCFLVELESGDRPRVSTSRPEDAPIVEAMTMLVADRGWRPWGRIGPGDTQPLPVAELPEPLRSLVDERGWRRASVTPVHVDGAVTAAFVLLGRVPDDYDPTVLAANVRDRFRRLVDVTALILVRWHDQDRLLAAATRDPLTGLANRDAVADALGDAGEHTVVLYVDIDHFKQVNDCHGHDVGDRVLVAVAERIVRACRPVDVVARYGGDEFVVLLHDVDAPTAEQIGERIVELVRAPLTGIPEVDAVTVSVGLAGLAEHHDGLLAADRAMLQAKREGRSRLVTAEVGEPGP